MVVPISSSLWPIILSSIHKGCLPPYFSFVNLGLRSILVYVRCCIGCVDILRKDTVVSICCLRLELRSIFDFLSY